VDDAGGEGLPVCASLTPSVEADGAVRRSYKFRLRPTSKQEAALCACLEDTRQLYNAALEERREAWRMCRRQVTFYSQGLRPSGPRRRQRRQEHLAGRACPSGSLKAA